MELLAHGSKIIGITSTNTFLSDEIMSIVVLLFTVFDFHFLQFFAFEIKYNCYYDLADILNTIYWKCVAIVGLTF